uniref:Uncharacterized protein n=1 Tax=Castor canadensis TaxID=51338 RepID=A0A8C0VXM6_CASCN
IKSVISYAVYQVKQVVCLFTVVLTHSPCSFRLESVGLEFSKHLNIPRSSAVHSSPI